MTLKKTKIDLQMGLKWGKKRDYIDIDNLIHLITIIANRIKKLAKLSLI